MKIQSCFTWTTSLISKNGVNHQQDVFTAVSQLSPFYRDTSAALSAKDGAGNSGISSVFSSARGIKTASVMRICLEGGQIKTISAPRGNEGVERFATVAANALDLPLGRGDSLVYVRDEDAGGEDPVDWAVLADTLGWNNIVNRYMDSGPLRVHVFIGSNR